MSGYWEVSDVREDKKIYPGYAERFHQAFPAQVCVSFTQCNYDALNERSCCDQTCHWCPHEKDACIFAQGASTGQYDVVMVTYLVIGFLFEHIEGPTAIRKGKRKTATCTPAAAHANSTEAGANPATGQEGLYMCSYYMYMFRCIITVHFSWQSAEKEREMVHQLLETRKERDHLNGECYNRTYTRRTTWQSSCFAGELTMVKKISSAKDLELDEMQLKVKVSEGKLMCPCIDS